MSDKLTRGLGGRGSSKEKRQVDMILLEDCIVTKLPLPQDSLGCVGPGLVPD